MAKQMRKISLIFILTLVLVVPFYAQNDRNWDNQIYLGNKVQFGKNKWKFSGELQTRLKDNFQSLDNWFFEFTTSYMYSKNFEFVPDLRFSIKPTKTEFRPGFGVLYKIHTEKIQYINQLKWQIDLGSDGKVGNAMRAVLFLNYKLSDKIVSTTVAGFIYRWWPDWNGIQYIRVGPGLSYVFDESHILNFNYFIGVENKYGDWQWAGIPVVQLVINLTKKYKYIPAFYFDF
jgi:hypothetical protein